MKDYLILGFKIKAKILLSICIVLILFVPSTIYAIKEVDDLAPEKPGPFKIGHFKVTYNDPLYGTYLATIRYPAKYDGFLAPKLTSDAPYPGIAVSNGWAGSEWNIKWIPKHLTSHGYVTICFTPPNKLQGNTSQWASGLSRGIETLKIFNDIKFSPIYKLVDTEKFGAIGLSMGGGGCIEATGSIDSEIDAAVALAPTSSNMSIKAANNISVPLQIQVGNNDGMVQPERVIPYFTDIIPFTVDKEYLSITGGNHIGYVDDFVARLVENFDWDNPKGIEFSEQREISQKYFTAWFEYYIRGIEDYYTYIYGEKAQNDFNSGILSDFRYYIES